MSFSGVLVQACRWALAVLGVWLWLQGAARAEAGWVYLDWQPPVSAGCPPRSVLEQDVEQALGRSVFTRDPGAHMTVRGTVVLDQAEIVARLDARSREGKRLGTRELRALDCAGLRNSLGLVLTLLVEREAQPALPAPELAVGLWSGLLGHVLPRAAVGVGPALSLALPGRLELRADAAYWLPVVVDTEAGKRAVLSGVTLAPRLCPWLVGDAGSSLDLRLCGGAQLGALLVDQTRPAGAGLQARLWAQALVELRSALRLRPLTVELAAGPLISLSRTQLYALRDDGTRALLYRMPLLGVFLAISLII